MDAASAMSTLMPTASGAPAASQLFHGGVESGSAPGHHGYAGTFGGQRFGDRQAHSFTAACDDSFRSGEAEVHRFSLRSVAGLVGCGESSDHLRCDAQPAKAEAQSVFADLTALTIACRPLPFGACPHHALDGLRFGGRVDAAEHARARGRARVAPMSGSSIAAYAGWISSGEANICDWASEERQRRSDLMFSSNARSSRASIQAATASTAVGRRRPSFFFSRRVSTRAISRKTAATSWSLDSKCR